MSDIIINTTEINTYETLKALASSCGKDETYIASLWDTMVLNPEFMNEFIYYIEHGTINDKLKIDKIGLSDLYVQQLQRYNLFVSDLGKNTSGCNKTAIMLDTFVAMAGLINNTNRYESSDLGMDIM